jgi:hypothetical protein
MVSLSGLKTLHDVWKRFSSKHRDFVSFGKSLYPDAMKEGTLVAVYVKTPDNQTFDYHMTLDGEDASLAREADAAIRSQRR